LVLKKKYNAQKDVPHSYEFEMRHAIGGHLLGGISFRIADHSHPFIHKAGHVGYSVRPGHRGHQYSARSIKLLFPLAARHNLDILAIIVNSDNIPSVKVCERLGGACVEEFTALVHNKPVLRRRYHVKVTVNLPVDSKETSYEIEYVNE